MIRILCLLVCFGLLACRADQSPRAVAASSAATQTNPAFVVIPSATNAARMRLHTNASPDAPYVFNSFDLEVNGATLLPPLRNDGKRSNSDATIHNILIDGNRPLLAASNGITVLDRATGPEWSYVALDATAAYRDRVKSFKRSILFVEPDLFVLYDHVVANEPVSFKALLHLPSAVRIDQPWRALRLDLPAGGMTVHTPVFASQSFGWSQVQSPADTILTNTITMQLAPTNKLAAWDVLTVFAAHRGSEKKEWAFKLLQSDTAFGARIFRDGLPTLVAFVTDASAPVTGLGGYEFKGPVGVYVFRPKVRR